MTQAPTVDDLLEFEAEWDRALVQVLGQLPFPIRAAHGNDELVTPCMTCVWAFGGEAPASAGGDQPFARNAAGHVFDGISFLATVTVEILVNRKWLNGAGAAANRKELARVRGGLRRLFLPSVGAFNSVSLPWYQLRTVAFGEALRDIDEVRDLDITTQRIALQWAILPEAWPAGQ